MNIRGSLVRINMSDSPDFNVSSSLFLIKTASHCDRVI